MAAAGNGSPKGIWSDKTTVWVVDDLDNKLYAYTLATGARDSGKDIILDPANGAPWGIWSDGTIIWVTNNTGYNLYAYTLDGGTRQTDIEFLLNGRKQWPTWHLVGRKHPLGLLIDLFAKQTARGIHAGLLIEQWRHDPYGRQSPWASGLGQEFLHSRDVAAHGRRHLVGRGHRHLDGVYRPGRENLLLQHPALPSRRCLPEFPDRQ